METITIISGILEAVMYLSASVLGLGALTAIALFFGIKGI